MGPLNQDIYIFEELFSKCESTLPVTRGLCAGLCSMSTMCCSSGLCAPCPPVPAPASAR